jgi:hypothetical protein
MPSSVSSTPGVARWRTDSSPRTARHYDGGRCGQQPAANRASARRCRRRPRPCGAGACSGERRFSGAQGSHPLDPLHVDDVDAGTPPSGRSHRGCAARAAAAAVAHGRAGRRQVAVLEAQRLVPARRRPVEQPAADQHRTGAVGRSSPHGAAGQLAEVQLVRR